VIRDIREISDIALEVGRLILQSGGTTNRCEKMMTSVCRVYGFPNTQSFVTPTGIFISVIDADLNISTQIKRIEGRYIDLGKISLVNELVNKLEKSHCQEDPSSCLKPADFMKRLQDIDNYRPYPEWVRTLCGGGTSGFFCLLFGGSWLEFIVAFFVGILVSFTMRLISLLKMNNFLINALGAAMVVTFAKLLDIWVPFIKLDNIIIGGIMLLVPGLSFVNAIRDTMSGDLVSGTARAVEALFIAIAIATGSGVMLKLWALWGF